MKLHALSVSCFIYAASLISGFCFDVTVHAKITGAAVNGSSGFSNYLSDNNIAASKGYLYVIPVASDLNPVGPTPSGMIFDGSIWEDEGSRPLNHFYDPIANDGLSVSWPWPLGLITFGLPSATWGSLYDEIDPYPFGGVNEYSWQNARWYQSNSIVEVASGTRNMQEGVMFSSIGQVLHLLQDTAQPQHVRNEEHLDQFPHTTLNSPSRSVFENWSWHNLGSINFPSTNLDWMPLGFNQIHYFWDRDLYDGTSYGALDADANCGCSILGLAEFCNGNFLTVRGSYGDLPGVNSNGSFGVTAYPYPKTTSTDLSNFLFNPRGFAKPQANGTYRFTLTKSSQGVTVPQHSAIDLLAAYYPNAFTVSTTSVNWVHPDDPDVIASYHSVLIPKAIAYSTGLLNYYFRGRLQIVCSQTFYSPTNVLTCEFTAMNISPQGFSGGGFRVFSDDGFGNRTEAANLVTTYNPNLVTGGLPTNETITGTFTVPPGSAGIFTLAYFGTIGHEGGAPLDPVDQNIGCASVLFTNCPGNYCGPFSFRGVAVSGLEPGDGVWANMYTFLKNYDVSNVPWGYLRSEAFSDPSLTEPDNLESDGEPVDEANPGPIGFSTWFVVDNTNGPFAEPGGARCQVLWPKNTPYGVFAVDAWNALQTGLICGTGITSSEGPCGYVILDIPMPTSGLPGPIPWNRCHYVAEPGLTPANMDATYSAQLAFGVQPNYGANWDTNFPCYPSPYDPFTGELTLP